MLHAITYGRVSTDKQEMDRQDRSLNDYCQRLQLNILTRLSDPDVSGSIPMRQREAGAELMGHLKQFPQLQIVTTEQDRIGRDTIDQIQTIRDIWQSGATPHFVLEGGALPRTDENEFKMEIRASIAQYERNKIKSRIKSKLSGKRAAGELCGTVTFGWNVRYLFGDGTELVRNTAFTRLDREFEERRHGGLIRTELLNNPEEHKWIKHIIARRNAGWSDWRIAKELNSLGVKSKNFGQPLFKNGEPVRDERGNAITVSGNWQAQQITKLLASTTVTEWLKSQ